MHAEVLSWLGQFRTDEDLSVLDIGGRDLNGSPRSLFPNASPYHVLDLRPGPNVDVVADATTWTPDRTYDLVICTEVFEHARDWPLILWTAWQALRPGGWLLFTCAGPGRPAHSGIEAVPGLLDGEWYANVSPQEIEAALISQGWAHIETHLRGTDTQGAAVKRLGARPIDLPTFGPAAPPEVNLSVQLSRTAASPAPLSPDTPGTP